MNVRGGGKKCSLWEYIGRSLTLNPRLEAIKTLGIEEASGVFQNVEVLGKNLFKWNLLLDNVIQKEPGWFVQVPCDMAGVKVWTGGTNGCSLSEHLPWK